MGHLDMFELEDTEETQEQGEVEKSLVPNGHTHMIPPQLLPPDTPSKVKVDYEIPRKLLHSSIGNPFTLTPQYPELTSQ
jgi:hypothetical protein